MQSQAKPSPNVTSEEIETLAFLAFHRGNFMMILGQIDEALKDYSRAIELSPIMQQPITIAVSLTARKVNLILLSKTITKR